MAEWIRYLAHRGDFVIVEASAAKLYPRMTLASASTLSGSVVRTLRKEKD